MEGLSLLLDKSALEMLNPDELEALFKHYFLVVPPILITEIIGDLYSKKRRHARQDGIQTELVQTIANKISTNSAIRNYHYRMICAAELVGEDVDQGRFRPVASPTTEATDDNGRKIALIDQDQEMELILKWQKGDFSDEDHHYAQAWKATTPADLEEYKRQLKTTQLGIEASSVVNVRLQLDARYRAADQSAILNYCCACANLSIQDTLAVRQRWQTKSSPRVCDFAPYTYFCLLVEQVFAHGLTLGFIDTSKSQKNDVDLQYVFYFPFARNFVSHDAFHKTIWEVFGNSEQQSFVWGADFKTDLRAISDYWLSASEEQLSELRKIAPHPPLVENSLSVRLFEKVVALGKLPAREELLQYQPRKRSPEEERAIVDRLLRNYNKLKGE